MRTISEIAREIRTDWKRPYFGAVPYLDAMHELSSIEDKYYFDDAHSVVAYFSRERPDLARPSRPPRQGRTQRYAGALMEKLREYLRQSMVEIDALLQKDGELSKWDRGYLQALADIAGEFFPDDEELLS